MTVPEWEAELMALERRDGTKIRKDMVTYMEQKEKKISKGYDNELQMEFDAISYNEGFARMAVSAFIAPLNPTVEEMADVKTAVSEAVTNAIIHGYGNVQGYMPGHMQCPRRINGGKVRMYCRIEGDVLFLEIEDDGKGIDNVDRALEPLFTTRPELERSGMGFAFMEAFMDDMQVLSAPGRGCKVVMEKKIGSTTWVGEDE